MASKVVLVRCADYDERAVGTAIDQAVESIGGWDRYVRPGQTVLVKPNLLTDTDPDAAVTTHPEVVRAVIRAVKTRGAVCRVGDSPSSVLKLERVWERTGMRQVCLEEDAELVSLEQGGAEHVETDGMAFDIARPVLDADVVINLPKVKTHVLTSLTCAVKNTYWCVPGLQKTGLHRQYFHAGRFSRVVAAVYARVRPALAIADGVVGMDGDGPSSGRVVPFGFIAASSDAVALDTCMCRLLGIDLRAVPYLGYLERAGIGETAPERIAVLGESIEALRPPRVDLPNTLGVRLIPQWLVSVGGRFVWSRPRFTDRCVQCGLCVKTCPVGALGLEGSAKPLLDRRRCVECCCCHEVCPCKAVDMEISPAVRMVQAWRKWLK